MHLSDISLNLNDNYGFPIICSEFLKWLSPFVLWFLEAGKVGIENFDLNDLFWSSNRGMLFISLKNIKEFLDKIYSVNRINK